MSLLLLEVTIKDFRSKTDAATKLRSRGLVTKFKGINKAGTLSFETTSGTSPGKVWKQKVKLLDLPFWLSIPEKSLTLLKRVRLALEGDIKITCNDPSFKYWGWSYYTTQQGAKLGFQENRFPVIRNPNQRGSICKHLENTMKAMPFIATSIVKELRKKQ